MKTLVLYRTMFKQTFIGLKRYLFETLSGTVTLYLFFLAIFYGAKAFGAGGPKFGNALEGIVVGYMVWTLAIFCYFSLAQDLTSEAQLGTLEQLAMSPLGLPRVILGRALAGLVWQLITMSLMLVLMMASTGKWLNIDVISILPIVLLTIGGVVGLGLAMAGLAIVFKKVQSALQIMQMAFIALVALPIGRFEWLKFMPLSWGKELLNKVMIDGGSIFSLPVSDVAFLVVHAGAYLLMGVAVFGYFERIARQKGLLGHY